MGLQTDTTKARRSEMRKAMMTAQRMVPLTGMRWALTSVPQMAKHLASTMAQRSELTRAMMTAPRLVVQTGMC